MTGQCGECGRPKNLHLEGGECPGGLGTMYLSMDLPDGKTCRDCIHFRFCTKFIGHVAENTSCDWYPSRFQEAPAITELCIGESR